MERPDYFNLKNGNKSKLPFSKKEYERRLKGLREIMNQHDLEMVLLTSMHGVASKQSPYNILPSISIFSIFWY